MEKKLRILVVDDMTTTREFLAVSLRELGVRDVTTTSSARDALDRLGRDDIDLVISDLHMPGMDGIELYRSMKTAGFLDRVQFVLATSDSALAELPDDYQLGGHKMLRKPYSAESLVDCLDDAVFRLPSGAAI